MEKNNRKYCVKCAKHIKDADLHKIIIYVVDKKFTEYHYEHIECPERWTV